jgi:predicted O-linked N-acetylglucosamine transferase (SPINDLY family)
MSAALLAQTVALHQAGRLAEAEAGYRTILSVDSDHVDALHLLGVLATQTGRAADGAALIARALERDPGFAAAHSSLGRALGALGHAQAARGCFARAVELEPKLAEAHLGLGNLLQQMGDLAAASAAFGRALAARADYAEAWFNLGNARAAMRNHGEAASAYCHALVLAPGLSAAAVNVAIAWQRLERPEMARSWLDRAVALAPDLADARLARGGLRFVAGALEDAIDDQRAATVIRPEDWTGWNNLGNTVLAQGRQDDALSAFYRAATLEPEAAPVRSNIVHALHYRDGATAGDILAAARAWDMHVAALRRTAVAPFGNVRDAQRRLTVGFVSSDFRTHSVAYFALPLLQQLDRGQVEIVCYAEVPTPDATTRRFQASAGRWRDIVGVEDRAVAAQVRADRVDVLIDLTGHMGSTRLGVFACRAAPVQATWCGFPGTTGLAEMDWRLTDAIADPPGLAESHHVERLALLDGCFLAYGPPEAAPTPAARTEGPVAFGSFNNLAKVTPRLIALWARILADVPKARLLLKSHSLADGPTRDRIAAAFGAHGIAAHRLDLRGFVAASGGHLATYGEIDLALDTLPYNGTATTCEALWMGVPVITRAGDRHSSRVGASLLTAAGLPELVAADETGYVALAVALARDAERRGRLRAGLREGIARSRLTDWRAHARAFERALREMWRDWLDRTA